MTTGPTHGLPSTYSSTRYGCRCRDCTTANTKRHRQARADRRDRLAADPSLAEHGHAATYTNWMCRCPPCTAAHSEQLAARRADRKR
ncbi:hypothetical protein [Micromonospora sp. NPDC005324]|uniref:hypothetical protein n=1 Tax=Micromonospora sp. NPDC005324 TaxID=3157033 RepID=UPI0033A93448